MPHSVPSLSVYYLCLSCSVSEHNTPGPSYSRCHGQQSETDARVAAND